jgi:hypothetical protein
VAVVVHANSLFLPVPVYLSLNSKLHIGAIGLSSPQTVRSKYETNDFISVDVSVAITYEELKVEN